MAALSRASSSCLAVAVAFAVAGGSASAAGVCGAQVAVRQIAMTPNADGTRTVRYRASVQTDQTTCSRVSFTIVRSYIKPDGTAFEDVIPVEVQVPGRSVDVEGDTLANTRRLIYWRAEKVACQPCASAANGAAMPVAPVPAGAAAGPVVTAGAGDEGGVKLPRVGRKAVIAGGAAAALATGAVLALGGSSAATSPGTDDPAPSPTATASATAAPTAAATPTPTPEPTPKVFPGAPPAAPADGETGDISLVSSDPPTGTSVAASRPGISMRLQVYIERVGTDMRLDLQLWSGGEMCLRDVSAPLDIKSGQPVLVQFPLSNVRRCAAPFRTTLFRAQLNDRGTPKIVRDFPVGFDFTP